MTDLIQFDRDKAVTVDRPDAPIHPVDDYLSNLNTETSRASMRSSLSIVARELGYIGSEVDSKGRDRKNPNGDAYAVPWGRLDYGRVNQLRVEMEKKFSPSSVNKHLAALRGVIRSGVNLGYFPA